MPDASTLLVAAGIGAGAALLGSAIGAVTQWRIFKAEHQRRINAAKADRLRTEYGTLLRRISDWNEGLDQFYRWAPGGAEEVSAEEIREASTKLLQRQEAMRDRVSDAIANVQLEPGAPQSLLDRYNRIRDRRAHVLTLLEASGRAYLTALEAEHSGMQVADPDSVLRAEIESSLQDLRRWQDDLRQAMVAHLASLEE